MNAKTAKPLPFFRRGRHVSNAGETVDYTDQMLSASARAYDPKKHEAPLTIGHPKDNKPAFGWVNSLEYNGATGDMSALPRQVEQQFAEMVNTGRFKKRSASWYPPDHPANPVPGVYYLRHIAFLGAQPPAIKGIPDYEFSDDGEGCVTVEFDEGTVNFGEGGFIGRNVARAFRSLREWMLEKFDRETADRIIPDYMTDSDFYTPPKMSSYSEPAPNNTKETTVDPNTPNTPADGANAQDFAERERAIAEREKKIQAEQAKLRRREYADFVESLIKDPKTGKGRILPKHKAGLVEFMCALAENTEGAVLEFSEKDGGETVKQSPVEFVKKVFAELPPVIDYTEQAGSGTAPATEFSEIEECAQRIAKAGEAS